MDHFINWLSTPMTPEDINTWNQANNIIPELSELFRDFCFSFYYLIVDTYLGDDLMDSSVTRIALTHNDKLNHYEWCWNKTIDNFKKENITFKFSEKDYEYFQSFFFEVYYEQNDKEIRDALEDFLKQFFNSKRPISKSDLEMFTDVYKTLERSLQI